jgi:hypothetical protein
VFTLGHPNPGTMKNAKLFSYLLLFVSSFFVGCTTENLDHASTAREIISKGRWSVDYCFAGQDQTAQFHNYQFSFTGNGTVTANNDTSSIAGIWSIMTDVDHNEVLRIRIDEPLFQVLNDHWTVTGVAISMLDMKCSDKELRLKKL